MSPSSNASESAASDARVVRGAVKRPESAHGEPPEPSGRAVLVTGGTRGIGLGIALRFRDAGARVLVCGRHAPDDLPPGVEFTKADVRDPDQAAAVVTDAVARLGRLDVAVNNAGGTPTVAAAEASASLATSVVRLNLLAPFFVAQAAYRVMRSQPGGGLILNIGSVSSLRPAPGTAVYAAAKAGLVTLTQALALEWAPEVRVNCVSVGLVATPESAAHYGGAQRLAAVAATVPLGRMAVPGDVGDACLLLASPLAGYVTGANLVLDGGGQRPSFLDAAGTP